MFRILDNEEQLRVLESVDISSIPMETLLKLNTTARYDFISSLEVSEVSKQMLEIISKDQRSDLCKRLILKNNASAERLNELFGNEYIQQVIEQMIKEKPEQLNDRILSCVTDKNKANIIILSRLTYSLQQETRQDLKDKFTFLYESDEDFKKYLLFRYENNVNSIYDNEINPGRTIMPLSDIIAEYANNAEIIKAVLNSEECQDKRTHLLLKYYIQESYNTSINITSVEELKNYPKQVLEMQQTIIENGNRGDILNVITQNLTGLSSEEFEQYRNMFLENHDLESVLESTGRLEKLKNLTVVKELLDLTDTMDDKQMQEFASNLSLRNYNELMQGDFSLVSMRESFREFLSNIEQEYGKEINQSLGYSVSGKETVEYMGQKLNISDIYGPFKLLTHMTKKNRPNNHDNRTCMSLLSEGHYEVAMGDYGVKEASDVCFFIFDDVPPELLYASANHNMSSNARGRTSANFMSVDNTILNAEEEGQKTGGASFTEQTYWYQGVSKDGKFIKIKPTALASFQAVPNEHTLKIAAKYGLDILRIPDMQTNLQGMLERGVITPGLVKGLKGDSSQIIDILSRKNILTHNEVLALQTLRGKEESQEIQQQIDQILEKIPKARGKKEVSSLTNGITLSEVNGISAETRQMYKLINNPQITQEKE